MSKNKLLLTWFKERKNEWAMPIFFAHAIACAWVPKPKVLGQVRSGRSTARGEDSQLLGGATYRRNAISVLSLPRGGLLVGGLPRHVGAAGARPTLKGHERPASP